MTRLFVGLPCPPEIADRLAGLQAGVPGARWLPCEDFHLTLRFLGETGDSAARELDAALSAVRGRTFDLAASGVGLYGRAKAVRALWAGVEPPPELLHLQEAVVRAARRSGIALEARRFRPHFTVARLRQAPARHIQDWLSEHAGFRTDPVRMRSFVLYSSVLSPSGPRYTAEVTYPLEE